MCKTIHTANQILPQYVGSSVIRQSRFITLVSRVYSTLATLMAVLKKKVLSLYCKHQRSFEILRYRFSYLHLYLNRLAVY
jgi:predicted ATPase